MIIYIAGPYSSTSREIMVEREAQLTSVAAYFANCGAVVFSPVTHGARLAQALPSEMVLNKGFWRDQCLSMLRFCDVLILVPLGGWGQSSGLQQELDYAARVGIPVFLPPHGCSLYDPTVIAPASHRYRCFPKDLLHAIYHSKTRHAVRRAIEHVTSQPFFFGDERAASEVYHGFRVPGEVYSDGGPDVLPDGGSEVPLPEGPAPHADSEGPGRNG